MKFKGTTADIIRRQIETGDPVVVTIEFEDGSTMRRRGIFGCSDTHLFVQDKEGSASAFDMIPLNTGATFHFEVG